MVANLAIACADPVDQRHLTLTRVWNMTRRQNSFRDIRRMRNAWVGCCRDSRFDNSRTRPQDRVRAAGKQVI
jgi:hypothetical protein